MMSEPRGLHRERVGLIFMRVLALAAWKAVHGVEAVMFGGRSRPRTGVQQGLIACLATSRVCPCYLPETSER